MNVMTCPNCRGHGRLPHYSSSDFLGEKECDECRGSGIVQCRDKRGRFVKADEARS